MSRKNKYKELSINTLLFAISSIGTKFISFLLVPLYTYVLTTADYGTVDLVSSTVQLLIPVLTLNIQDAVLRFTLDEKHNPKSIIGAALKIIIIGSLILLITLILFNTLGILKLGTQYVYFLFLSFVFGSVNNCFSMYLKAINRVRILTIGGLLNTFLTCSFNILFLLVFKLGVTGYLIANTLGTAISLLFLFFAGEIYKEIRFYGSGSILRQMIPYCLPLVVNSLAWWLNNASDRYILLFYWGAAINGIYAISYKIPTILSTFQTVFYNAWSISAIVEFDKDDKDGFIGNVYSMYSCISILGCSMLLIGNIFIADLLYSKDFFVAWKYVPPLLVGAVFNGIALFEGCLFTAVKRTKDVSKTTILAVLVNIVLNFLLIPKLGALGAAIATMIGYISIWAVRTIQMKQIITMKVHWFIHFLCLSLLLVQSIISLLEGLYWIQIPVMILIIFFQKQDLRKLVLFITRKSYY